MISKVFLVSTKDRMYGIRSLMNACDMSKFSEKDSLLKANFNSADPFPGSTHIDTLRAVVTEIHRSGGREIRLLERSGMGDTRRVLEDLGVMKLAKELKFSVTVLDELSADEWRFIPAPESHWPEGLFLPVQLFSGYPVLQTCCLKTHRFGGHFTLSLKNSVGLVAKRVPGISNDFMYNLHGSPYQRLMIAEINQFYPVDLVLMDAIEGFGRGGPESGERIFPHILLAANDRVAIDVVSVAILRHFGSTPEVMQGRIMRLEQIARAVELGIGASSPDDIELVSVDEGSREWAEILQKILEKEG
jgi:uncharacterized protein (DUF362 family)